MQLLALAEVERRLALSRRQYLGIRAIPLDRIVGSVDRSEEFGRDFKPLRPLSRNRIASLRTAFPDGSIPAIRVFEVGGGYFVEDGHHRVALAREQGASDIDAEVTRLETSVEVGPDVDVAQLVHTEQQRKLLDDSGLSRARPDAVIEFSFVDGYPQLADVIKAHGYDLARRMGRLPSDEQVAADWYDSEYRPGVDEIRRAGLFERDASLEVTEADHFLWVYKTRRDLRARDAAVDWYAAALHTEAARRRGRSRRDIRRGDGRPLPARDHEGLM